MRGSRVFERGERVFIFCAYSMSSEIDCIFHKDFFTATEIAIEINLSTTINSFSGKSQLNCTRYLKFIGRKLFLDQAPSFIKRGFDFCPEKASQLRMTLPSTDRSLTFSFCHLRPRDVFATIFEIRDFLWSLLTWPCYCQLWLGTVSRQHDAKLKSKLETEIIWGGRSCGNSLDRRTD